jgi:glycerate-2-kinase
MVTATLQTTVQIEWQDYRGRDRECELEVTYTFDGDDLRIVSYAAPVDGYDGDMIDGLVWDAVTEQADEAFAEWLNDRDDAWLEARADERLLARAAGSYVPPMGAA